MPFAVRSPRLLVLMVLAACGSAPEPQADSLRASPAAAEEAPPPAPAAAAPAAPPAQEIRGVRTTLRADDCTTLSVDEEAGGSEQRCPGTAGYALLALDGDARMSITILDPAGGQHPLDYWERVTFGFSSLGDEAEWRVRGEGASAVPIALIVPLMANEHPDDPERVTPYHVIAKITPAETCVTHALYGETPADEVRRLADASATAPCRASLNDA